MSLTQQARYLFRDRRMQCKWVLAQRYLIQRQLQPYRLMPMAARIVWQS